MIHSGEVEYFSIFVFGAVFATGTSERFSFETQKFWPLFTAYGEDKVLAVQFPSKRIYPG